MLHPVADFNRNPFYTYASFQLSTSRKYGVLDVRSVIHRLSDFFHIAALVFETSFVEIVFRSLFVIPFQAIHFLLECFSQVSR
ncbi:FAD linked oxidase, C-terminal domain protein [Leptospira santarosai]|nr:FAD linked oxidase, C-terminal domain protein [Leptospira santarosai]